MHRNAFKIGEKWCVLKAQNEAKKQLRAQDMSLDLDLEADGGLGALGEAAPGEGDGGRRRR